MSYFTLLCSLFITWSICLSAVPAQVIIIPNGEVDAAGNLTQQGLERAGALADYIILTPNFIKYGSPTAIFAARPTNLPADNTQACMLTIAPTASQLSLSIHSGYSKQQNAKISSFILNNRNYNDKSIVICWRTDSMQALASSLGVVNPPAIGPNGNNVAWLISFSPAATLEVLPQNLFSSDATSMCGCGTVPYPSNTGYLVPEPIIQSSQVWSFVSEPNLHPMKVTVNQMQAGLAPGLIFVAPYAFSADALYGQPGSLIMDNEGNPIWFRPLSDSSLMNTDFRVQTYNGKPVLTFWQGTLATPPAYTDAPGGSSESGSCYYIVDNTYAVIKNVSAQNGYTSDIHEFLLTPDNTALFLATKKVPIDLTPYGGPQNGYVQDFSVQEVDLQTNELVFFWSALDHIPLTDSYEPASSAISSSNIWDAYHLNSVGLTDLDSDIVVSARNMWTVYRINKPTGNIVWRLGGKASSFTIAAGGTFSWQHDARFLPTNVVSLFDDNCCEGDSVPSGTPPSHGLKLQLDLGTMTASVLTTYFHDPNITVSSQGNVESLSNGNVFVGWGQSQYFSEYAGAGNTANNPSLNLLYDASMPGNNYTYRAYRAEWTATPSYPPSISVVPGNGVNTVYASWNGSTETNSWQVFAGTSPASLSLVGSAVSTSFETSITVASSGPYFLVKALDIGSVVIGVSDVVSINP